MTAKGKRAEAKAAGLAYYFTGEPCSRGHIAERQTVNGVCRLCGTENKERKRRRDGRRLRSAIAAETNAALRVCSACKQAFPNTKQFFVRLIKKQRSGTITIGLARECRECRNKRFRPFYLAHRDEQIERAIQYVRDNPIPKRNRDMQRYMRRKKRNGCPPWADQKKIEAVYAIADFLTRKTGVPHEVDHYYPLMHPLMCGLHVHWNMRVITAEANQRKGNRLPPEPRILTNPVEI
jgi:hypothetical protein